MRRRVILSVLSPLALGCMPPEPLARGPAPETRRHINPGTLAALDGFTHAVKVGGTVYVAGQVALDSAGRLVGAGDLRAQARQAFANLALVLRIAGATPADVTRLTVYVVNLRPGDFEIIRQAAPEFFPQRSPPAGVVLGVAALPREDVLLAVDAIAFAAGAFLPRAARGP